MYSVHHFATFKVKVPKRTLKIIVYHLFVFSQLYISCEGCRCLKINVNTASMGYHAMRNEGELSLYIKNPAAHAYLATASIGNPILLLLYPQ